MKPRPVRYSRAEKLSLAAAARVLDDASAKPRDTYLAQLVVQRIQRDAERRQVRAEAIRLLGRPPRRKDFASEATFLEALAHYRAALERIECERVLDDPTASLRNRALARRRLKFLERGQPSEIVSSGRDAGPIRQESSGAGSPLEEFLSAIEQRKNQE